MAATSIQWCDHSINPIRARNKKTGAVGHYCEKIAAGCAACYSSAFQKRFGLPPFGAGQHRDEVEIFLDESKLDEVRRRKKPTKYFWCDMTDFFGDWMQPDWLAKCFDTMDATPQHTHLLLTKRPENVRRMWPEVYGAGHYSPAYVAGGEIIDPDYTPEYHRPNVWLGTSFSTQSDADRNILELVKCRDLTPVLFGSGEPLLEHISLRGPGCQWCFGRGCQEVSPPFPCAACCDIDWLIIGCESGHNRRPMRIEWAESLALQCRLAGIDCFMKQMEIDGKVSGEIERFPQALQVRQFPATLNPGVPAETE